MTKMFEIFISGITQRVAVVEAASIIDAHDRALDLFPDTTWDQFIVVPTEISLVVGGVR